MCRGNIADEWIIGLDTAARHLTMDIWLSVELTEHHVDAVKECVRSQLTVLKEVEQKFEPQGLTVVFILSESHFSIHTYPEHNYLSLDCYICNPSVNLEDLSEQLLELLPHKKVQKREHARGQ